MTTTRNGGPPPAPAAILAAEASRLQAIDNPANYLRWLRLHSGCRALPDAIAGLVVSGVLPGLQRRRN